MSWVIFLVCWVMIFGVLGGCCGVLGGGFGVLGGGGFGALGDAAAADGHGGHHDGGRSKSNNLWDGEECAPVRRAYCFYVRSTQRTGALTSNADRVKTGAI